MNITEAQSNLCKTRILCIPDEEIYKMGRFSISLKAFGQNSKGVDFYARKQWSPLKTPNEVYSLSRPCGGNLRINDLSRELVAACAVRH